jgi:hypothetical protein
MSNPNIKIHAAKGGKVRWMPKATHQGILKIMGKELPCVVLEDGRRILTEAAVLRAFNKRSRGSKIESNYPVFMEARNLDVFITEEIRPATQKIEYMSISGSISSGYSAEIIPIVCDIYLTARNEGKLTSHQVATAEISEMLVRSLSKVGIISLVDEATGYQQIRPRDALESYLNKILSKELATWCKRFPDIYYSNIYKLKGWPEFSSSKNKYSCVGNYTNDIVYSRLGEDVLEELKSRTPDTSKNKLHQWLSIDTGHPLLTKHMTAIITLQNLAVAEGYGWKRFLSMVDKILPKKSHALDIDENK